MVLVVCCKFAFVWVVSDSFFFFKQKTAYEMRISDWSSDVCSSDLLAAGEGSRLQALTTTASGVAVPKQFCSLGGGASLLHDALMRARVIAPPEIGRASCRERVCQYG